MVESRHRKTVRILLQVADGSFLMFFSAFDPGVELPPRWIFPGGGIEPGESPRAAAVRELLEETGLVVPEADLVELGWFDFEMESKHEFDTGEVTFFKLVIPQRFEPSNSLWTADEHRDTISSRWLNLSEIRAEELWVGPDGAIEKLLKWRAI
jgi:8-oxo-dGTP pyrophosphatase MutT (NUDIX family)